MASTIKSNTVTNSTGSTLTLGESGTTVTLACGATQSGFGRTDTVDWCTTVKTSPLTAVSGKGYMINTCGGAITVTLPSSPTAGDIVSLKDYKDTWGTACKAVTLGRNSSKIGGNCIDATLDTAGQSITMVYVDGTQGWLNIQTDTTVKGNNYITASGGTESTCGDYKIHKFTSDGTFTVSGLSAATPANNTVAYMVIAGGGGGGGQCQSTTSSGGAGAGGFREGTTAPVVPYTASPLVAAAGITVTASAYPIAVGGGGAGGAAGLNHGVSGSNSVFSTITSAGGGYGSGVALTPCQGSPGGSGGGAKQDNNGGPANGVGIGNTPPVSPSQGTNGGTSDRTGPTYLAGGGGGATVAGGNPSSPGSTTGAGGTGATSSIDGTPTERAGGGGAGKSNYPSTPRTQGPASGGGGAGGTTGSGTSGTANTGGGGGGAAGGPNPTPGVGGTGGSGIVILRYRYQ
jgi:hypothetical protein